MATPWLRQVQSASPLHVFSVTEGKMVPSLSLLTPNCSRVGKQSDNVLWIWLKRTERRGRSSFVTRIIGACVLPCSSNSFVTVVSVLFSSYTVLSGFSNNVIFIFRSVASCSYHTMSWHVILIMWFLCYVRSCLVLTMQRLNKQRYAVKVYGRQTGKQGECWPSPVSSRLLSIKGTL